MQSKPMFCTLPSAEAVAQEAVARILTKAQRAISARGTFRLVLAGGSTPVATYRLLAQAGVDWSGWEFFFGDERCLPVMDPQRNDRAARRAWLDQVPIPPESIHVIPAEQGPKAAAQAYAALVERSMPFDLVLLGLGEDGHTASLFPGHSIPGDSLVMPVLQSPKPPPERVSLTPAAFAGARGILILVTGTGKREAIKCWRAGSDLPIAQAAAAAPSLVLLDARADGANG